MPQTWAGAKAEIVTLLSGLAGVETVYADPPESLQDVPCFVIYSPAATVDRRSSLLQFRSYRVRMRYFSRAENWAEAAAEVDAMRELVLSLFDANVRLNFACERIQGPDIDEGAQFEYPAGTVFVGFDSFLTVVIRPDVEHLA